MKKELITVEKTEGGIKIKTSPLAITKSARMTLKMNPTTKVMMPTKGKGSYKRKGRRIETADSE